MENSFAHNLCVTPETVRVSSVSNIPHIHCGLVSRYQVCPIIVQAASMLGIATQWLDIMWGWLEIFVLWHLSVQLVLKVYLYDSIKVL